MVYDIIKDELGDLALMIRPTFNMVGQEPVIKHDLQSKVGPEKLLVKQLEGYDDSNVDTLATDLYGLLSKDKIEEANEIINQFYNDYYVSVTEDVEFKTEEVKNEEPSKELEDVQVKFDEVLK